MNQEPYFKDIDKESLKKQQDYFQNIKDQLELLKKNLVDAAISEIQKKVEELNNGYN